jgi:hypothetical protein
VPQLGPLGDSHQTISVHSLIE